MLCDICGHVCEPGKEFSAFMFTGYNFIQGQMTPMVRQEEYCASCTDKVKRLVEGIKHENSNN